MKNLTKLFVAVAALFAFSCVTDATEDLGVNVGGQTTLTLSLEEASKTQLGEKVNGVYHLYWSEGDQISVNGVPSVALTAGGSAEATFAFNGTLEYPYNVVYPASEGTNEVTFLASQSYTAGSFCAGAAPMCGYAEVEGSMVQLQHLAGVLRFDVSGTSTLSSLSVVAPNIAGTFTVDCATGALTAKTGETSDRVSVSFGEGLALGTEATPIYVAVPAGVYGEVSVVIYSTTSEKMVVKFDTTEKPIAAGKVREFKPFEFAGTIDDSVFIIDSKDALIRFAANPSKDAIVVANIDMTGVEWTPIEGFAHKFDGGEFEIKGLTAPLFGTTTALEIKNVKLTDVKIVETVNPTVGALARLVENVESVITNCSASGTLEVNCPSTVTADYFYTAGLIGKTTTVKTLSYLTNAVDITVNGNTYDGYYVIAGCVGSNSSAAISDSTNLGVINVNATTVDADKEHTIYICGITKHCLAVTNCVNGLADDKGEVKRGSITYNNADNVEIIVMAGVADQAAGDITKSHNYGDLTIKGKTSNSYMLGIVRAPSDGTTIVSECTNSGKITSCATTSTSVMAGILNGAKSDLTVDNCHNYGAIEATSEASFTAVTHLAGIVASATDRTNFVIKNCTNSGAITTNAKHTEARLAGILGSHARSSKTGTRTLTLENLSNTGNITVGASFNGTECGAGGIVAVLANKLNTSSAPYTTTVTLNDKMYNSGNLTYNGTCTNVVRMGGVISNCEIVKNININGELENDGDVVANTELYNKYLYIAGVITTVNSVNSFQTNAMLTNNGDVSITASNSPNTMLGGCFGVVASNSYTIAFKPFGGMTNNGAIYSNNTTANSQTRAGGMIACMTKDKTHNCRFKGNITNNGTITIDGSKDVAMSAIHAAGFIAQTSALTGFNLETCNIVNSESATISITENVDAKIAQVGGINANITCAMNNDKSTEVTIVNKAEIKVLGKTDRICAGGVFGITTKPVTVGVTNIGNVICRGTYDASTTSGIGGIIGSLNSGATITITGARCFCDVEAVGYECVGMITGFDRNDAHRGISCHVGGRISRANGLDGKPEFKILAKNFVNGAYDEAADEWAVDTRYIPYYTALYPTAIEANVAKSDQCGYISAIDATPVDSNGESLQ